MDVSNVTCLLVAVSYSMLSMCCGEKLNTECKQKLCLFTKKFHMEPLIHLVRHHFYVSWFLIGGWEGSVDFFYKFCCVNNISVTIIHSVISTKFIFIHRRGCFTVARDCFSLQPQAVMGV